MRSLLAAGLLAGVALARGARPGQAPTTRAPCSRRSTARITLGHVIALRDRLPPQYQELPDDVLLSGLLDQLIDQQLLAAAAVGVARGRSARGQAAPRQRAARRACGDRRRGRGRRRGRRRRRCRRPTTSRPPSSSRQPEFNAAHILVDSEDEGEGAEGRDRRRRGLRRGRQGQLERRLGRDRRRPRLVRGRADGAGVRGRGDRGCRSAQVAEPGQDPVRLAPDQAQRQARDDAAGARGRCGRRSRTSCARRRCRRSSPSCRPGAKIEKPETGTPAAAIRETDLLTN